MTGAQLRMSLEAIRWVLRDAPDVPAQCVGVLIGLAEHADKFGRGSYPSAGTLAAYARKSKRQVHYDMSLLTEAKLIRLGDQSLAARLPQNRRPVVYDLALELVREVQPTSPLEAEPGVQSASGVQSTAPLQSASPQGATDLQEHDGVQPASPLEDQSQGCNAASPGVQSTADKPSVNPESNPSSRRRRDLNEGRDDAMRLCAHLADRVEGHGSLRPEIGKKWLDAARLMLDTDRRTEEQIHKAIDWCQDDEFWRGNVMSMPKLRKQYDQLRLKAKAERARLAGTNGQPGMRGGARQQILSAGETAALDPGSIV
jgi:hypothetical protein